MGHVALDAMRFLEVMAEAGRHPQEAAEAAESIAAGWWLDAAGDAAPERLVLLVQELRRWCAVASSHYAAHWDRLSRAGRPEQAEEARRWTKHRALRLYG